MKLPWIESDAKSLEIELEFYIIFYLTKPISFLINKMGVIKVEYLIRYRSLGVEIVRDRDIHRDIA